MLLLRHFLFLVLTTSDPGLLGAVISFPLYARGNSLRIVFLQAHLHGHRCRFFWLVERPFLNMSPLDRNLAARPSLLRLARAGT